MTFIKQTTTPQLSQAKAEVAKLESYTVKSHFHGPMLNEARHRVRVLKALDDLCRMFSV